MGYRRQTTAAITYDCKMLASMLAFFMAQLTVRNLDDQAYARLKERAKANKRSLEAEARSILEESAMTSRAEFAHWAAEFRKHVKPGKPGEATAWIREDRDRR
ncbi:MAG: hypothetical protein IT563_23855 [Alphaproteobacteria bacterium]|nr:hypothetical protein [Alphaproteobacteria bacterium]